MFIAHARFMKRAYTNSYMKNTTYIWTAIIILVLLIASGAYAYVHINSLKQQLSMASTTPMMAGAATQYSCSQGSLSATFGTSSVMLMLPNARMLTLPQAVSGSGFRYESGTIVFNGKGSSATLTENGTVTYGNCLAGTNASTGTAGDTNAGMKTFTDSSNTFKFTYPGMFALTGSDAGYTNDWSAGSAQLGLVLAQVTIPQSFEPKTNFGDAKFTVGTSADPAAVKGCLTQANGSMTKAPVNVTINGVKYAKLTFGDAGAGNLYDTTSYRTVKNNQCYAIEYTIHSSQFANYPAGSITMFDQAKIQSTLDSIAQSFSFL
ncbi:MAG: hypothetical protein JWM39_388 [Parcubacteria group bacterium]|nr:hypothetical protein [Parcubacteria group bacterium]